MSYIFSSLHPVSKRRYRRRNANYFNTDDDSDESNYSSTFGGNRNNGSKAPVRPGSPVDPDPVEVDPDFAPTIILPQSPGNLNSTSEIQFPFQGTALADITSVISVVPITGGPYWTDGDADDLRSEAITEVRRAIDGDRTNVLDIFNGLKQPFPDFSLELNSETDFFNIAVVYANSRARQSAVFGVTIKLIGDNSEVLNAFRLQPEALLTPTLRNPPLFQSALAQYGVPLDTAPTKIRAIEFTDWVGSISIYNISLNVPFPPSGI